MMAVDAATSVAQPGLTRTGSGRRRLPAFRKNRSLYLGGVIVAIVVTLAVAAPLLAPAHPLEDNLRVRLRPPIWAAGGVIPHLLGTDEFGRDLLSRILYGARVSLSVGVLVVLVAAPVGSLLGLLAGFYGGAVEALLMRLADAQHALPGVLLAIVVVAVLGTNMLNLVLVLAISSWVIYSRIVFSSARALRDREFVTGARALGASDWRLMRLHILPNTINPIIVIVALQVGRVILIEAGLSFLGLGVPPPEPSWGGMLAEGRNRMLVAPWVATLPGLAIVITVWGINMFGDGLRQALDPRLRSL
jgi:peptide/nickel transport system permease protein